MFSGLCLYVSKGPDGTSLVPWKMERCLVSVAKYVETLAASHLRDTAEIPGAVLSYPETLNRRKYASISIIRSTV